MPEIKRLGQGEYIRQMLYAYPGWRKTSFVATTPDAGFKTLLIRTAADQLPARALKADMDEIVISTWEDMMGGGGVLDWLRYDSHGYEFVWWDCISIGQDILLDDVWAATIADKPTRNNLTPAGGLDRGEYGRNMERIQQFIRHLMGVNAFHVGLTAHPVEDRHPTNDEGGTLLVPYIQGKNMTSKICGYCNIVAFQEIKEADDQTWARMHFRENSRFYAKDLYDAFPKGYMDNPTMPKLWDAVQAAKKGTSTTRRRRGMTADKRAATARRPGRRKKGATT